MTVRRIPNRLIVYGLAACIIIVAAVIVAIRSERSGSTPARTQQAVTVNAQDTPAETVPGNTYVWPGKQNEPQRLTIPRLSVNAYIERVGIGKDKSIEAPKNIHIAGWYGDSQVPGQPGLSIIDGHVDGVSAAGVFINLNKLGKGDTFSVTLGNGTVLNYAVEQAQTVPNDQSLNLLFSQLPGVSSQLNLITCGGTFDKSTRQYQSRTIVYARLL